jgi:hypothetical protein
MTEANQTVEQNVVTTEATTEISAKKYKDFSAMIKAQWASFVMELDSGLTNKSSGLRARQLSMKLRELLKEYKKISTENDRSHGRVKKS